LTWLGNSEKYVSTGFSKNSDREFKIWDTRSGKTPITTKQVELASGVLKPMYDADIGVLFLAGRGDTSISYHELINEEPFSFPLSSYPSGSPIVDVAMLPKTQCDVANVEIDRFLKLSTTTVEPIYFSVPRNRLEYFQDDLFPLTPKFGEPVMSSSEWFQGANKEPQLISLKPEGLATLSNAPKIVKEKKYKFDPNKPKEVEIDIKEAVLSKFYSQMTDLHKDATPKDKGTQEVADDEWTD